MKFPNQDVISQVPSSQSNSPYTESSKSQNTQGKTTWKSSYYNELTPMLNSRKCHYKLIGNIKFSALSIWMHKTYKQFKFLLNIKWIAFEEEELTTKRKKS